MKYLFLLSAMTALSSPGWAQDFDAAGKGRDAIVVQSIRDAVRESGCETLRQFDLGQGEMRQESQSGHVSVLTAPMGSLTFVRCPDGDEFALTRVGMGQTSSGGTLGSGLPFTGETLDGMDIAFRANRRRDGSMHYRMAWKARSGQQYVVALQAEESEAQARARLESLVRRFSPLLA